MVNIKKISIGLGVFLLVLGLGTYLYWDNVRKIEKNEEEVLQLREELKKKDPKLYQELLDREQKLEDSKFKSMEYYKESLGMSEEEVKDYFKSKDEEYVDVEDIEEAREILTRLRNKSIKLTNEEKKYFGKINSNISDTEGNILIVSYGIEGGLSNNELINCIKKAKEYGVQTVYSYSNQGLSDALSIYLGGITNKNTDNFTGGVSYSDTYPQVFVLKYGDFDKERTLKLSKKIYLIDSRTNLLNGGFLE